MGRINYFAFIESRLAVYRSVKRGIISTTKLSQPVSLNFADRHRPFALLLKL